MASIDKFSSGRKLKTYGKLSRNQSYTHIRRASNPTRDILAPRKEEAEIAEKNRAHKGDSSRSTNPHPKNPRARTPAKKCDENVFDVPSSDDESHTNPERWRKRRKLSGPPVPLRSKGFDDVIPERRRARHVTPSPKSPHPENKSVMASPVQNAKSPEVEVVIKTPRKVRKVWDSVPTSSSRESQVQRENNGASANAKGDTKVREPATSLKKTNSLSQSRQKSFATDKREQSSQQSTRGTPADKLRRMTAHLTSASKPTCDDSQSTSKEPRNTAPHTSISNARTPGTPSRTRLVDALGIQRDDHVSDSSAARHGGRESISPSPSERSLPSVNFGATDNSQKSSLPEPSESDQPHQTLAHPRRAPVASQKVTYARQRSFLTEADIIEGKGEIDPLKQLESSSRAPDYKTDQKSGKRPALPKNKSSLSFESDGDDDNNSTGAVRSIYELRRSGSNARFEGIIETIFDDLEDEGAPLSCKRSNLIQLCSKLGDYQFAHRFLSSALHKRLAKCTEGLTDLVCAFLLAYIYALLLSTTPASPIVLRTCNTQMSRIAPLLLQEERDITEIAKQRESKMTKAGYTSLKELATKIQTGKIWADQRPKTVSPQVVALRCTELTVRRVRETGDSMEPTAAPVLERLVDLLLQQSLAEDIKEGESNDLLVLELAFSILESYTVGLGELQSDQEVNILSGLARLGPLLSELTHQPGPRRRLIQGLEIRLILNITNNNSRLCEDFSTPELVQALADIILSNFGSVAEELASSDKKESLLDTVILALGALINLTEWSGTARRLILESQRGDATLLEGFIELFSDGWEAISEANSVVQTHSNVVFGYLSVLLSTLALDDDIRARVRAAPHGQTLDRLLSTVEEFLHYHRKVEEEIRDVNREEDAMAGFTSRLQGIVNRIRDAEGGCR